MQLTLDEIQASSQIFEYKQDGHCVDRSISCISPLLPVPSSLPFRRLGWLWALAALEMEAVQGGSTGWELCWDLGDCSSAVPIATGVWCWLLEEAAPVGRARLRCRHQPGWWDVFCGWWAPEQPRLCWASRAPLCSWLGTWRWGVETHLCSVQLHFVEHKACLNVLLLSAVHGVFLECQTQMLILGISGKS